MVGKKLFLIIKRMKMIMMNIGAIKLGDSPNHAQRCPVQPVDWLLYVVLEQVSFRCGAPIFNA